MAIRVWRFSTPLVVEQLIALILLSCGDDNNDDGTRSDTSMCSTINRGRSSVSVDVDRTRNNRT